MTTDFIYIFFPPQHIALSLAGPPYNRQRDAHRQHARGNHCLQPGGEDWGPWQAGSRLWQLRHRYRPQPRHQAYQVAKLGTRSDEAMR
jgi:hypothetical protein